METLSKKYIWIVGASSGIGAALAKELDKRGATVAISARRQEKLDDVLSSLKNDGHIAVPMDVTNKDEITAAREKICESFPHIDSIVHLAAIYEAGDSEKNKSLDFIHKALSVNIGGVFNVFAQAREQFNQQSYGQYVICGSVAGYRGLPNGQPYSSTKAALTNLAESLKVEHEKENIDIKLISPGFVKTDLTAKNDFEMPFIIEAEEAAKRIADGLTSKSFEIHFPKRLTLFLKLIRILPYALFFPLARNLKK